MNDSILKEISSAVAEDKKHNLSFDNSKIFKILLHI
jgi:hypothetical protein